MLKLKTRLDRTKLLKRIRATTADVKKLGTGHPDQAADLARLRACEAMLVKATTEEEVASAMNAGRELLASA